MSSTHIGTKLIRAEPMDRAAYNAFRNWNLPTDENGADEGYLVEYQDGGMPNVPGRAGYVSWTPKEQFDAAYRPCEAMTFGLAIEALKKGLRVARSGWNGKGMYLVLVTGGTVEHPLVESGAEVEALPAIGMWTVNAVGRRAFLHGWLASQTDMLAEDWRIVEA